LHQQKQVGLDQLRKSWRPRPWRGDCARNLTDADPWSSTDSLEHL